MCLPVGVDQGPRFPVQGGRSETESICFACVVGLCCANVTVALQTCMWGNERLQKHKPKNESEMFFFLLPETIWR